ncbi:hypothetical protein SEA_SHIDA_85 [Mycobacterium phage Shida]|nr:hypothetical protein SEA_SHIDA_85 [Mycobacterium phage Shida]QXO13458.1 hypothetical protein SEA_MURAI_86 [Mycobacterium phage Murai]WNO28671.1 hypothetical protein SEA_MADKILLAH_87 [Mycobacterium phage MadKillah]
MNSVTLSDDRRKLVVTTPDGSGRATFWAQDPGGFTDEEVQLAREKVTMYLTEQGGYSVRRTRWFGREVFLHRSSGKPTWWRPRVEVRRGRVLVGWLRRMAAVTW